MTGGINWPPVEPTELDRGCPHRRKAGTRHQRNGDDADRHHVAHRGARDHAEQRGAEDRDLGRPAAEAAHCRHREIGKIIGTAGAAEHLPHQREGNDDEQRDRKNDPDHAVGVEPEIGNEARRRHRPGGEIARHMRADEDIKREDQNNDNQHAARRSARRLQHEQQKDRAADHAVDWEQCDFVGQSVVAIGDITADDQRGGGGKPIEPSYNSDAVADRGAGGDEAERQTKPQAHRQQLLGIERHVEQTPRQVEYPADDAEDQGAL